jgi:simple sugar transport system permease protein
MSTAALRSRTVSMRSWVSTRIQILSIGGMLVVLGLVFSLTAEAFLTPGNMLNLLRQLAPLLVVSVAATFVITTAGIDLSVGSLVAFVSASSALLIRNGFDPGVVLTVMLVIGALFGSVNGYFIGYQRIPAFIVTLAGLTAVRGLALLLTQGYSIPIPSGLWFVGLGQGRVAGIPLPVLIAVPVVVVGWVVLTRTRFGNYVTGVGSNEEAVRRSGVNTKLVTLSVYLISGVAAALGGVLVAARLGSGSANAAVGFELEVIAAVVLGGTSLFGGEGSMVGTLLGALTIGVIGNGLILLGVSPFYVPIVQGVVLLVAILVNTKLFGRFAQVR